MALFLALIVLDPEQGPLIVAAIAWAAIVAFSRCIMGRHYQSDVFAGLLVGILTTMFVTKVRKGVEMVCFLARNWI